MASALPPPPSPSPSLPPPPPAAGGTAGGGAGGGASSGAGAAPRLALHVVIVSLGTRGDTQPFAALGLRLQRRGHRVTLATEARMEGFVRGLGLEWRCIAGDSAGITMQPGFAERIAVGERRWGSLATFLGETARWEAKEAREGVARADVLRSYEAALAGADVVVSGTYTTMTSFCVAESIGARWCPMVLQSFFVPTAEYANDMTAVLGLGCRCLNLFTHELLLKAAWEKERADVNAWRAGALGLKPIRDRLGAFGIIRRLGIPTIVACSALCCGPRNAQPDDAPRGTQVGGFVFLPSAEETGQAVDGRVVDFLARAETDAAPVVYLGLGSMPAKPDVLVALAVDVCARVGCRAVIVAGWTELDVSAAAGNPALLIAADVPHDWLFPRMSCVLHHCGIGTMAAGLRAGVPQVPMPFLIDQPFNAALLMQLGVAPAIVPWTKADAPTLAAAVTRAINPKQPFAAAARRYGDLVRAESAGALDRYANAVESACAWTESGAREE